MSDFDLTEIDLNDLTTIDDDTIETEEIDLDNIEEMPSFIKKKFNGGAVDPEDTPDVEEETSDVEQETSDETSPSAEEEEEEFDDDFDVDFEDEITFTGEVDIGDEKQFNLENLDDVYIHEEQIILKGDIEIIEDIETQIQDYIDEATRLLPKHLQTKKTHLNYIQKEADNFINLKKETLEEDIILKRKGDNYKPLLDSIMNIEFSNARLIPIVSDTVKLYSHIDENDTSYYTKKMDEELIEIDRILKNYIKLSPDEYSYKKKLKEIDIELDPEKYNENDNGFISNMKNDTLVIRNCFDNKCHILNEEAEIEKTNFNAKKLLGQLRSVNHKNEPINYTDGQTFNLVGFMATPSYEIDNSKLLSCKLNFSEFLDYIENDYQKLKDIYLKYKDKLEINNIDGKINLANTDIVGNIILFLFPKEKKINEVKFRELLQKIIPKPNMIVNRLIPINCNNLNNANKILGLYNLSMKDLVYNDYNTVKKIVQKNLNILNKKLKRKRKSHKQRIKEYNKKTQSLEKKQQQKDYSFITNKILDNLDKQTNHTYSLNKYTIDNDITRIEWYLKGHDQGETLISMLILMYYKKLKDIFTKINIDNDKIADLKENHDKLDRAIQEEQNRIDKENNNCSDLIFVKRYFSLDSLKLDNNKTNLKYDFEFDKTETKEIKPGNFAILHNGDKISLYQRIEVTKQGEEKTQIWNLESNRAVSSIMTNNKDLCNQNKKHILDYTIHNEQECMFIDNKCVSRKLIKLIKKRRNIASQIKSLEKINSLKETNFSDYIIKIGEKIKKLQNNNKYSRLKLQNKLKQHYNEIVELQKNRGDIEAYEEDYLITNGKEEEIYDYEESEGFTSKDVPKITRSIMIDEKSDLKSMLFFETTTEADIDRHVELSTLSDIADMTDNSIIDTRSILGTLIDKMGISLYKTQIEELITDINNFSDSYIQTFQLLRRNLLKRINIREKRKKEGRLKPKQISDEATLSAKKNYPKYKQKMLIIITATKLLIYLQTSIPDIKINSIVIGCAASIGGYPLIQNKANKAGLDFISCVLIKLSKSGSPWNLINKRYADTHLLKIMEHLTDNYYNIKDLYAKKRNYINDTLKKESTPELWNSFRPPLEPFSDTWKEPEIIDFKNMIDSKFSKIMTQKFKERNIWVSSKRIDLINDVLLKESIVNKKYLPIPLSNSILKEKLSESYNALKIYNNKDSNIGIFTDNIYKLSKIDKIIENMTSQTKININTPKNLQNKYSKYLFSEWDTLENNDTITKLLIKNFTLQGPYKGKKRKRILDNIQTTYNQNDIINIINKTNIIPKTKQIEKYSLLETLKNIKSTSLKNNKLLSEFIDEYEIYYNTMLSKKKVKELFQIRNDFWINIYEKYNKNIKMNLYQNLDKLLKISDLNKVKQVIDDIINDNCGFNKIYEQNIEDYGIDIADDISYKMGESYIKKYILNIISVIIYQISNKNIPDENIELNFIKLDENYKKELKKYIHNNKKKYEKFMQTKYDSLFKILSEKIEDITKYLDRIISIGDIFNCKKKDGIKTVSLFNYMNSKILMEFLFLVILKEILDSGSIVLETTEEEPEEIMFTDESSDEPTFININDEVKADLIKLLIESIEDYKNSIDNLTYSSIIKDIESITQLQKEDNLGVMKRLSEDSRKLKNTRLKLKIDKYQDLSKMELQQYMIREEEIDEETEEHIHAEEESNMNIPGDFEEDGEDAPEFS